MDRSVVQSSKFKSSKNKWVKKTSQIGRWSATTRCRIVSREAFRAVREGVSDPIARAGLIADLCRINTLFMIMQAGSGHIGSSFSSTDIITWLWTEYLRDPNGATDDADTYFSSKGHDAPALYSLLIAMEKLGFDLLPQLRRINGLPGHPDVATPFIATNTGSLGMGISKAYGMARANRYTGRSGRIVVMTGDGELQEGQIWESLQPVANEGLAEITVIVDHNKLQSDSAVAAVSDLGPIEEKFRAFGWEVRRGDGHDFAVLRDALAHFATITDRPKVFIADTIKGKGVSFMEGLACGDQTYHFHAGAPSLERLRRGDARDDRARQSHARVAGPAPRVVDVSAVARAHLARQPGEDRSGLRRRAARDGAASARDRRDGRRPVVRLRHRGVQGGVARALHRVRHRRNAHGVGRRRHGAARHVAGGAFVCLLPVDARQRTDLQQRDREAKNHLHRHAGRPGAWRPGPFASIGARHFGDRRGAGAGRLRAVQRA